MSVRVLSRVLRDSPSRLAARLVLIALADVAADDGVAWQPQATLAAKANVDEATVRRALRDLEAAGEIETRKAMKGRQRINVYRVLYATDEIEYDRLPFRLEEPFAATGDDRADCTVSTSGLDRADRPATTGQVARSTRGRGSSLGERNEQRDGAKAPSSGKPPGVHRVDGRDLPFDALAEVCGVVEQSPRMREVATALNGSKSKARPVVGIRYLFWAELVGKYGLEATERRYAEIDPAQYEQALANAIEVRALLYRRVMNGATLTPLALAKWWADLPGMALSSPSAIRLTPEDIASGRWRQ
jgi:DNA-binding Lrp family transcriptional regulator